ncbi:protein KRTCAP2 homolog [Tribolium madens]|uniref:protein KRTCAP2 homolog n=1 Tax=Tribolium madens TaxID=41895 RepID=UPI001CF74B01|nr:protein KRTCAP2 homolog [Tribolium madens]
MTVTTGISFVLASISSVLVFSGMQMYKPWLSSSQLHTLLGGYLGSIFFVLSLTAVGNLETCVFGRSFQVKVFPEVLFCLFLALFTSATVHRVSATSCLLISLCALFYMNKHSQKVHAIAAPSIPVQTGKKKKNVS